MNNHFTVDYFIKKFTAIPENSWLVSLLTDYKGSCCALGHCGMTDSEEPTEEAIALANVLSPLNLRNMQPGIVNIAWFYVYPINDGHVSQYKQSTAKERILAALYDVKALEASQSLSYPDVREELAASVVIGDSVDVLKEVEGVKN